MFVMAVSLRRSRQHFYVRALDLSINEDQALTDVHFLSKCPTAQTSNVFT